MKRARLYPETKLKSAILAYLRTQQDVWAERRNSGSRRIVAKGMIQNIALGEPGTPDITGYLRAESWLASNGKTAPIAIPFGIEVKLEGSKLNENQKRWHAKAKRWGVEVCVARSIGEVRAFVEGMRRGEAP